MGALSGPQKYSTIVADPPWHYPDFVSYPGTRVDRNKEGLKGGQRRITKPLPYPSMTVEEICALPVVDLAERDCALWLWTTSAYLRPAFDVVEAWGFQYRQMLVWYKNTARPHLGGSVAPNHAEFLLVAKRGKPEMGRLESSVIVCPGNSGGSPKHSRKPEVFLDLIEQASPAPRLEMFARRNRFGWSTWGNESLEHVEMGA